MLSLPYSVEYINTLRLSKIEAIAMIRHAQMHSSLVEMEKKKKNQTLLPPLCCKCDQSDERESVSNSSKLKTGSTLRADISELKFGDMSSIADIRMKSLITFL